MVQDRDLQPGAQSDLDLAPQDTDFAGEAGGHEPSFVITVDAINYPCKKWETASAARFVEKRYDQGFNGGMGAFLDSQASRPNQIYTCVNIDPSTFPYIRMRRGERDQVALTLTGADTTQPAYAFVTEDGNNIEYIYIVNGTKTFKISLGANGSGTPAFVGPTPNVAESTKTLASAVAGRPVRYKGGGANAEWHVPMGANAVAQTLTTCASTNSGQIADDTWTPFANGENALAFAPMTQEGVAQLWMADGTNEISTTPTVGTAFSPATGFEIGDKSYAITDMLAVQGQLIVSKPNMPYRFDEQGNSIPVMEFVDATGGTLTNFQGFDGSCCGAHGPYFYWCHSTGLWRIVGDSAVPIDPFSQRNWSGISLDTLTPSFNGGWFSFAAWQRWAYATNASDGLYVGWIESDGTITWMGCMISGATAGQPWGTQMRCGIVATSTNPVLWLLDNADRFAVFDLELDGSMRKILTSGSNRDRGADNEQGQIWLPGTDFGEPEKQKQMRLGWLTIDNNAAANVDIEMRVHRDRAATSTQIGSAITSADGSGQFEFVFTPGSSDTFYEAMLAIRFDTNQAGAFAAGPADLRIRSCGMRAATPHIYRATIPLDAEGLRGYSLGVKDALKKLRDLKSSQGVTVREPGFQSGTFTGYILDTQERAKAMPGGRVDYTLEVLIQRWLL